MEDELYDQALLSHEQEQPGKHTRRRQAKNPHRRRTDKRQYASCMKKMAPSLLVHAPRHSDVGLCHASSWCSRRDGFSFLDTVHSLILPHREVVLR